MRKNQATFGRKRRHSELQFSSQESSQQSLTPKEEDDDLLQTQDGALVVASAATTAPPTIPVTYGEGLPKLLFEGLASDDADIVANAADEIAKRLETVSNHNHNHNNNKELLSEFVGLGGHAVILSAMQRWPHHTTLQDRACACLASLIHHWQSPSNTNTIIDLADCLFQMGALELIATALHQFPHDLKLQISGISAMTNLCCNNNNNNGRVVAQRICRDPIHGIQLVAHAMKEFPLQIRLQELGCWFYRRMCTCGMSGEPTLKTDALIGIATAVAEFPHHAQINNHGHYCLSVITKPISSNGNKKKKKNKTSSAVVTAVARGKEESGKKESDSPEY